ncbi:MAG: hypothetical protein Q7T54_05815 [Candidatus Levybacteria bacterium]|nr:hypothetical protein [Candidatus Levybacteria bacterium]
MNIHKTLTTLFVTGAFLTTVGNSFAAGSSQCQIVYGGGEVCEDKIQFTLDKRVLTPTKGGDFVDNLTLNDARFEIGNTASFKIIVKNTGDKKIDTLTVVDTLPQHLNFVSGAGTYNSNNRTITYTINNLDKGQVNEQVFTVTITNSLPANQGIVCLTNHAKATDNNGITASDTAGLCVQQGVTPVQPTPAPQIFNKVPVKNIPNTGPEMLPLLGLIPLGVTGLILRRKSTIN